MAHNSRQKKQFKPAPTYDEDDYVYPTKKVGQQTRNRRSDRKLIKAGLIEHNNINHSLDDWYDDEPMVQTNEEITNQAEYEENLDICDDEENHCINDDDIYGTHWDIDDADEHFYERDI